MQVFEEYVPTSREISAINRTLARRRAAEWQTVSLSEFLKPGFREALVEDWLSVRFYDDELGGF